MKTFKTILSIFELVNNYNEFVCFARGYIIVLFSHTEKNMIYIQKNFLRTIFFLIVSVQ